MNQFDSRSKANSTYSRRNVPLREPNFANKENEERNLMQIKLLINDKRHKELMKQNQEMQKRRQEAIRQREQSKEVQRVNVLRNIKEEQKAAHQKYFRQESATRKADLSSQKRFSGRHDKTNSISTSPRQILSFNNPPRRDAAPIGYLTQPQSQVSLPRPRQESHAMAVNSIKNFETSMNLPQRQVLPVYRETGQKNHEQRQIERELENLLLEESNHEFRKSITDLKNVTRGRTNNMTGNAVPRRLKPMTDYDQDFLAQTIEKDLSQTNFQELESMHSVRPSANSLEHTQDKSAQQPPKQSRVRSKIEHHINQSKLLEERGPTYKSKNTPVDNLLDRERQILESLEKIDRKYLQNAHKISHLESHIDQSIGSRVSRPVRSEEEVMQSISRLDNMIQGNSMNNMDGRNHRYQMPPKSMQAINSPPSMHFLSELHSSKEVSEKFGQLNDISKINPIDGKTFSLSNDAQSYSIITDVSNPMERTVNPNGYLARNFNKQKFPQKVEVPKPAPVLADNKDSLNRIKFKPDLINALFD